MSAPAYRLREMTPADLPAVAALEPELFGADAWSEQSWSGELSEGSRRSYVVATEPDTGTLLGYAGIDVAGSTADVMTIAVVPQARGRGVGAALLDALVDAARTAGADALLLEVRADNASAIRLYDRAGFETISVRRRYYQPGDVDAHVMRLLLASGHRATRSPIGAP